MLGLELNQLEATVEAYLKGKGSVTISGEKYSIRNPHAFLIFTHSITQSPQEFKEKHFQRGNYKMSYFNRIGFLEPHILDLAGKNVTAEFLGNKEFGELSDIKEIPDASFPEPENSKYLPLELFSDTRGYVLKIAEQAINSYDAGLFDACSVLTRKLIEVLIIEVFERHGVDQLIKKDDGSFYYLADLISELNKNDHWNLGRNTRKSLPKIKEIGDLSAHNRRYSAKQHDVDKIKDDLRIVLEELIHIIDYKSWSKEGKKI